MLKIKLMEKELIVSTERISVSVITDIVYSQEFNWRSPRRRMNILKPKIVEPTLALLFISGGGFITVNKAHCLQMQMHLAESGYLTAGVEYGVVGDGVLEDALSDLKTAIRFLRANAGSLNLNPQKIGVVGESAGGYLAAMLGVTNGIKNLDNNIYPDQSSEVQAVIDFYGYTDFGDAELKKIYDSAGSAHSLFLNGIPPFYGRGGNVTDNLLRLACSNPINFLSEKTPPFLLFHGAQDRIVPPNQTKILHEALKKHGIPSERIVVKNAGHAGDVWRQPTIEKIMIKFLNRYLKNAEGKNSICQTNNSLKG